MIATNEKLGEWLPRLRAADWIALDTEADSLHAYPEKLCLMQISIADADLLLDPLSAVDLQPVLQILLDHELILHGSDYDLRLLRKTFDFVPSRIFDTMLAGLLLGLKQVGLANLVARYLGITLEKGPQKADWAQRPLTERMEQYARNDTRHLKHLADLLRQELSAKGRLDWHSEMCARFVRDGAVVEQPDPDRVWRVKGSHALAPQGLAVLRELWRWREREAILANRPPYFVLAPQAMVEVAVAAVENRPFDRWLPKRISDRRAAGVRQAVQAGLAAEPKPQILRPRHQRLTFAQVQRYRDFERLRDRRAAELELDPSLIASRSTLVALARDGEKAFADLMNWQRALLRP